MMQVPVPANYSTEEYLARETTADYRSEYINGQIIPMADGKPNHNKIALNLSSALNFAFRQTIYDVYMSDLRLAIPDCSLYTYPDVMVIEQPLVFATDRQDTISNPILIAEILSDSTEKYDRGDKFRMYRTIPSFREYLLVSQKAMQVERFSKNSANQWVLSEYAEENSQISFDSLEFSISLGELYDRVNF